MPISNIESNRCDLLYGPSGVGKTENLGLAAKYVWEKYGKITRLVSADGGGWKPLQPYIDLGIIQPFSISSTVKQFGMMMVMSKGYWPKLTKGLYTPQPLELKDVDGDEVNGIPGVGAMMFEGLTSFADSIMTDLITRKGIQLPEMPKDCFVEEDNIRYGFQGRSHYAFVQARIQEMINNANGLPFKKMIWTALENVGSDPETGETCYGPKVIGKALTGKVPAWFGDCIHLVSMSDGEVEDDGRQDLGRLVKGGVPVKKIRAYLANHPHKSSGHMYCAKGRTSAWVGKELPSYFDVIINSEVQKGLNWVYEQEDLLNDKAAETISRGLKRPAPRDMFKIKGQIQGVDINENNVIINTSEVNEDGK